MKRVRKALVVIVGLTSSWWGLAGCSETTVPRQADLALSPAQARQAVAGIYVGTGRLDFAERDLVASCMREAGFDYRIPPQQPDRSVPQDYTDDVATARKEGYGLASEVARTAEAMAFEEEIAGKPADQRAAFTQALYGPPDAEVVSVRSATGDVLEASSEGCQAEAWTKLYGSPRQALSFIEFRLNTVNTVLFRARQDSSEVHQAFEQWQECMAERGYSGMEDRNSSRGLALSTYDERPPAAARSFELAIAEADAGCDQSSGYASVARRVEDEALARFLTDNEGEITAMQEIRRVAITHAQEAQG